MPAASPPSAFYSWEAGDSATLGSSSLHLGLWPWVLPCGGPARAGLGSPVSRTPAATGYTWPHGGHSLGAWPGWPELSTHLSEFLDPSGWRRSPSPGGPAAREEVKASLGCRGRGALPGLGGGQRGGTHPAGPLAGLLRVELVYQPLLLVQPVLPRPALLHEGGFSLPHVRLWTQGGAWGSVPLEPRGGLSRVPFRPLLPALPGKPPPSRAPPSLV